jgi:glycosyltransferase involved in cell wall biosynthesis
MRSVLIRAPLLSVSGYGVHSRQIFKWLQQYDGLNVKSNVVGWGRTSWLINPDLEGGLVGEIMSTTESSPGGQYDLSIQVQLPNEWDNSLAKLNVGVTAAVETDRCNPEWIEHCNRMNAIIVPSEHTKNTLTNTGNVTVPIYVIGESYFPEIDEEIHDDLPIEFDTDFNFLILGQLTGNNSENDRKNVFNTIKWICEEFKDEPDVGIILKTNSGRGTKIDKKLTSNILQNILKQVRQGPYPRVHFLHGNMSQKEIASLYRHNKVKALVSFTRGEGFGLPLLEAAASGLPVIATDWSSHPEFLNLGKWVKVPCVLKEIDQTRVDNNIFVEGSQWASVSEFNAKKALRNFYKKPHKPQAWAHELSKKIKNNYSESALSEKYDEVFRKICLELT